MATKAHLDGNKRYLQKQDEIRIRVPKDGTKERIQAAADAVGVSVNRYIVTAVEERLTTQANNNDTHDNPI